jgi:hypothetical protein
MSRRSAFALALSVLLVFAAVTAGEIVQAAPGKAVSADIRVILASRTDGGVSIDPQLRDLPQLTRDQPFVRYNVYRLLDRKLLPLEQGKPSAYPLVNGRTLQVTLVDVTEEKNEKRYHVRVEIGEPGKQAFLKLLEVTAGGNDPFFVAGQSYQGGTLFLGLAVRP